MRTKTYLRDLKHISISKINMVMGLVTNYGERGYKTGGGHVKFYPYKKVVAAQKVLR